MSCGCKETRARLLAEIGSRRFQQAGATAVKGLKRMATNIRGKAPSVVPRKNRGAR